MSLMIIIHFDTRNICAQLINLNVNIKFNDNIEYIMFVVFQNRLKIIKLLFQKKINVKNNEFIKHAVFNCINRIIITLLQHEISLKIDDE